MRVKFEEVLEFFFWGLEVFSRRDCGLILAGYRACDSEHRANQLLERMERRRLIERSGRGRHAKFRITAAGGRLISVSEPAREWSKSWDGKWRVFSYDLPEIRRKDRALLWKELRSRKLGLLQRSVWVWPHDVEPILLETVEAHGIPECFCGFEATRLFLCADAEVVEAAWDFEEIRRRHEAYFQRPATGPELVKTARDLQTLARMARTEREAYWHAFSIDPLLPRVLWPKGYRGAGVEERHQEFRARLSRRARALAA